jgi:hypothetical protein
MTLLNLLNDELSWHDREKWDSATHFMEQLFSSHGNDMGYIVKKAHTIKRAIDEMDCFIQQNTSGVCPDCKDVCCINIHGYYDHQDLIYIYSLGLKPPDYKEGVKDTDPCQFLNKLGCTVERSIRPFRCNWYFCKALFEYMENGDAKPYRNFINKFHEIIDLRKDMLDEFFNLLNWKLFYIPYPLQNRRMGIV